MEDLPLLSQERTSPKPKHEGPAYVDYGDEAKGTKSSFVANTTHDAKPSKDKE